MEIHNVEDADVLGNNPIYENNKVVGRATGGDFGFRLDKSIALGMVKPNVATTGQKLKIDILGKMYDATILDESPYCLLYTSPSPRDGLLSRMPSSA